MKRLKIILVILFVAGLLLLWMLPMIVEYYLEKNDVAWIGRELTVDDIDINLLTGHLYVENAVMYEKDGTTPFVSIASIDVNMRMWSLLSGTYEFEYIHLKRPFARMVQNGATYNYDDFKPDASEMEDETEDTDATRDPVKYVLNDIQLIDGGFSYHDDVLQSQIALEGINIRVPRLAYDTAAMDVELTGKQREGGQLDIRGRVDWGQMFYRAGGSFSDWQLRPYKNYLDDYLSIEDFAGLFNLEIDLYGDYSDSSFVALNGRADVEDFLLVDVNKDSLLTWDSFVLSLDSVNTSSHIYDIKELVLYKPDILVKYFEEGDNFTSLYLDTTSVQPLDTVRVSSESEVVYQNPFQYLTETLNSLVDDDAFDTYGADTMAIRQGRLLFQDFSHLEEADIVLEEMDIGINQVLPTDTTVHLYLDSRVNTTGTIDGDLTVSRLNSSDLIMNVEITDFFLTSFDPYARFYTAFPIWEGKMKLRSETSIQSNILKSTNTLFIEKPEVGSKLDNYDAEYNVPLKFAVGLLKDVHGNIEMELPIEGDLSDPDYKVGKIVLDVIVNLFIKAAASPYKLLARAFDASEEDLKAIQFMHDQDSLAKEQIRPMDLTARVLDQKEDLAVTLKYIMNEKEEREIIAMNRARQEYYKNAPDSINHWSEISEKDSLFITYLDEKVGGLGSRTVAEMCIDLVGEEDINARITALKEAHNTLVSEYLFNEKNVPAERLVIVRNEVDSLSRVYPRPIFLIEYDASLTNPQDSIVGPETPEVIPPPSTSD